MFDRTSRILICASHPDDETVGMAGTIARATSTGADIRVVFFGEGVTARYPTERWQDKDVLDEIAERDGNAVTACGLLGVDREALFFEQRPCCRFDSIPHIDLVNAVEAHLKTFDPTHVFTHARSDTNIDHRILHQAVLTATRAVRFPKVELLALFEVLSSTETNPLVPFAPDLFVDISGQIDTKLAAVRTYGREIGNPPHPRAPETVEALARYRGAQAGAVFAEAFETVRRIVR